MHVHVCFDGRPTINTGPATGQEQTTTGYDSELCESQASVWYTVGSCWGTQNFVGTRGVPSECWLSADRVLLRDPELCGYPWGTQRMLAVCGQSPAGAPRTLWVPVGYPAP